MLRRVAGHMTAPQPLTPTTHPASAASSVVTALAGAVVALAASSLVRRSAAAAEQPSDSPPTAEASSKDPNVVRTVEQLRELLPVAQASYGATGLDGTHPPVSYSYCSC